MKNRRVVITANGGPEVLTVIEEEATPPEPDEICLKVIASGVAFGDVLKRTGLLPGMPKIPFTPGYDCLGTVDIKGETVFAFNEGDTVAAFVTNGGNAEYLCIKEDLLVKVPDGVDPIEAAVIPLNYVTAYQMLHRVAKVKKGGRILIHGAAGGVGTAMLQLCRLAGIEAFGTASAGKHEVVRELGGTPIDYKSEDFVQKIRSFAGDGVDAVFDPVGGANLAKSFSVLKRGGTLVGFGVSSAMGAGISVVIKTIMSIFVYNILPNGRNAYFYGISGSKHSTMPMIKEDMAKLFYMLAQGKIKPVIGAKFSLDEAQKAHEMMENSGTQGKILIVN